LKRFRSWDLLPIVLTLLLTGFLFWFGSRELQGEKRVEIQTADGVFTYPIETDRYFDAQGPLGVSRVSIQEGNVWFESSPCTNQLCVQMGHKHVPGDWAACLPNRVFVRIIGRGEALDAISQ